MKPREKAEELIAKFYPMVRWKLGQEGVKKRAKDAALVVADEILTADMFMMTEYQEKFWEEVKQEIKKL